jgi:hypothetical protein
MKRVSGRSGWRANGPVRRVGKFFEHLLFEKRNLRYDIQIGGHKAAPIEPAGRRAGQEKEIFIWIRFNPLKRPDWAKGIQGNASPFIWICLVWFGE